nr:concanavalin A-like lectin/glucanase, subgroup [Tanacetum cinerariifolium]
MDGHIVFLHEGFKTMEHEDEVHSDGSFELVNMDDYDTASEKAKKEAVARNAEGPMYLFDNGSNSEYYNGRGGSFKVYQLGIDVKHYEKGPYDKATKKVGASNKVQDMVVYEVEKNMECLITDLRKELGLFDEANRSLLA